MHQAQDGRLLKKQLHESQLPKAVGTVVFSVVAIAVVQAAAAIVS